jgi:hypothetical protein
MNKNLNGKYNLAAMAEFNYIYRSLFRKAPETQEIESIYSDIHSTYFSGPSPLEKIISKGLNFECIEYYLRLNNSMNPVTQRAKVVIYLAELNKENYELFFNKSKNQFLLFSLITLAFKTVFKFLAGMALCKTYGIK